MYHISGKKFNMSIRPLNPFMGLEKNKIKEKKHQYLSSNTKFQTLKNQHQLYKRALRTPKPK